MRADVIVHLGLMTTVERDAITECFFQGAEQLDNAIVVKWSEAT